MFLDKLRRQYLDAAVRAACHYWEGGKTVFQRFLELAKFLQITVFYPATFLDLAGYLLGLLHGCCTDVKDCCRQREG
jgi:hypothetical protein